MNDEISEVEKLRAEVKRLQWLSNTYFVRQEVLSYENELLRDCATDADLSFIGEQVANFARGGN